MFLIIFQLNPLVVCSSQTQNFTFLFPGKSAWNVNSLFSRKKINQYQFLVNNFGDIPVILKLLLIMKEFLVLHLSDNHHLLRKQVNALS